MNKVFRAGLPALCLILGLGAVAARAQGMEWNNKNPENKCAWRVAVVEMPDAEPRNPEVVLSGDTTPPLTIKLVGSGTNVELSEGKASSLSARIRKSAKATFTLGNNGTPDKKKVIYFTLTPEGSKAPESWVATICCYGMGNGKAKLFLQSSTFPSDRAVGDCIQLNKPRDGCITFKDPPLR